MSKTAARLLFAIVSPFAMAEMACADDPSSDGSDTQDDHGQSDGDADGDTDAVSDCDTDADQDYTGTTCYVDGAAGDDSRSGLSEAEATRSQSAVDPSCTVVRFKRGRPSGRGNILGENSRMKRELKIRPEVRLREGIRKMIAYDKGVH